MVAYPYSGADISYAQGNPAASAFPGQFVIVNASRGNVGLVVGSEYHNQVNTMRAAGKWIGHYFFNGDSNTGPSPLASANFFVANLYNHALSDVLVLDVESTGVVAWTPAQALVFAKQVFALTGKKIGIYLNQSLLKQDWSALVEFGCWLWMADYSGGPYPSGNWPVATMVQTSSAGFDHDLSSKTFAEINASTSVVTAREEDDPMYYTATTTSNDKIINAGWGYQRVGGGPLYAMTNLETYFATANGAVFNSIGGDDLALIAAISGIADHAVLAAGNVWGPTKTPLQGPGKFTGKYIFNGTNGNVPMDYPYAGVVIDTSALQSAVTTAVTASLKVASVQIDPTALQTAITTAVTAALSKATVQLDPQPIADAVVAGVTPLIPRGFVASP